MPRLPKYLPSVLPGFFSSLAFGLACAGPSFAPPFEPPGAGLVFSFPADGQLDVPLGAPVALAFSHAVDLSAVGENCSTSAAAGLCVTDSGGPVAGTWSVVGEGSRAVEFVAEGGLAPGERHQVYVASGVLAEGASNAPSDGPIIQFTSRQDRSAVGASASVIAINGEPSAVFAPGSVVEPRFPLIDFATFRLVFSEPIDERTAFLGTSVQFVELPPGGGAEVPIPGQLLVQGIHLSFDPDQDLNADSIYELRISADLLDLGGEAAAPEAFQFSPESSHLSGELFSQVLDVAPGVGDANFPQPSTVSSLARNNVRLVSEFIGENSILLKDGLVEAQMAHPNQFDYSVPIVIRKGQSLQASGLEVALGGVVRSGLATGDLTFSFVSDVTGIMVRNSFWPSSTIPDNQEAPLHVRLTFDMAVSAVDAVGNAVLTQTIMGVQATGLAEAVDGQLLISNVATVEFDLLGITKVPAQVALAFATTLSESVNADTTPPTLQSTYPAPGDDILEFGDSVLLTFSEPVQVSDADSIELRTDSDILLDADIRTVGSMLIITPTQPLPDNRGFLVSVGDGLTDLNGNSWSVQSGDPTGGNGFFGFNTVRLAAESPLPPVLTAVYPGAPCALVGDSTGTRRCAGGTGGDSDYLHFEHPSNHAIEVVFDQPMQRDSLVLGTACGQGSFRVEEVSATTCERAVPGTLSVSERGVRFVPEQDWEVGRDYRLSLLAGGDGVCSMGELCGANGLPLNTDPLATTLDAGGPPVEIYFLGTQASTDQVVLLTAYPIVDRNGNAKVDVGETTVDTNRAAVGVSDVSGVISDATIDMPDCDSSTGAIEGCMYLSSDLVIVLEDKQANCVIATGSGTVNADHCIPFMVNPGAVYGTELRMDATALGFVSIDNIQTGKIVLRLRESNGPIRGYIIESNGKPEKLVTLSTYMDAPDLLLIGGLAGHDLVSKNLEVSLRGQVGFRADGRLVITLQNEAAIHIDVGISVLSIGAGTITLEIAAGGMLLNLVSRSARGGQR